MADQSRNEPFADLISLVAGPIAAVIRSFDQLRKGSDELMRGLENFNNTMATLNETAQRVNGLLNEFEEPIRALLPQVTRTLKTADAITSRLAGPVEDVAPGLERLASTLNSPVLAALPTDLGNFLDAINELVKRLGPLTQLADSAGGLFGLRIPGLSRSPQTPAAPPVAPPVAATESVTGTGSAPTTERTTTTAAQAAKAGRAAKEASTARAARAAAAATGKPAKRATTASAKSAKRASAAPAKRAVKSASAPPSKRAGTAG